VSVTINAHQLGLLLDKVTGHTAGDYVPALHGIRLDVDAAYLYAVASDRYTLAAARYRHVAEDVEPFARTIPAEYLRVLREWVSAQAGQHCITISTSPGRLTFSSPQTDFAISVVDSQLYPDWRGILRGILRQPVTEAPFPALDASFLGRWSSAGDQVRVKFTADEKAAILFADDFIGAQMPRRYSGTGPVPALTFEAAQEDWGWTLVEGAEGLDMATDMPDEERPSFEVTTDIRQTGADLLKHTLRSLTKSHDTPIEDRDRYHAHILGAVNGWTAYRFLAALYKADPRLAQHTVNELAGELDSGEIGEWAWDTAVEAGHDPQVWADEYQAHLVAQALGSNAA
jgi:hypothetical protein